MKLTMKLSWKKMCVAVGLAAALVLAMAMVAFSQGPHGGHGGPVGPHRGPGGDHLEHLAQALNLTDDQKTQIKKLMESFDESTKALRDQMRTLHESQPDPMSGAAFDEAAVRKAAQDRANVQVEMEVAHARLMSQIYNLLTAEQKTKLAQLHQQMKQRHEQWESQHPRPEQEQQ